MRLASRVAPPGDASKVIPMPSGVGQTGPHQGLSAVRGLLVAAVASAIVWAAGVGAIWYLVVRH
jgi:hypothetical protein